MHLSLGTNARATHWSACPSFHPSFTTNNSISLSVHVVPAIMAPQPAINAADISDAARRSLLLLLEGVSKTPESTPLREHTC